MDKKPDMQKQGQQQSDPKMPKFNMNWIYILAIAMLALFYFSNGRENSSISAEASYTEFKSVVMKGWAQKIVINKTESKLEVYVKPEHRRDVFKQGKEQTGKEPTMSVEFGSVDQVENFINQARAKKLFTGDLRYDNRDTNSILNIIIYNLLPIVLLVGL